MTGTDSRPPVGDPAADGGRFGLGVRRRGAGSGFDPWSAALGAVLVLGILGTLVWSAVAGSATPARHPTFFGGTIVLADNRPLINLDLATGQVDVQLSQISATVGAASYDQVQPVTLDSGTMLVNRTNGNFNLLSEDNFVVDPHNGGIGLGSLPGSTGAVGVADGDSAFIVRLAPASTVSLVGPDTVDEAAASPTVQVRPDGFAALGGAVDDSPQAMAAAGGSLYVAVDIAGTLQLERLDPAPGAKLAVHRLGALGPATTPVAIEAIHPSAQASSASPADVAVVSPGTVRLFGPDHAEQTMPTSQTRGATTLEAVTGATASGWFLADGPGGWTVFGVSSAGRLTGPAPLAGIPTTTRLAEPAASDGSLYTMAQVAPSAGATSATASTQPALWVVDPANGTVSTVAGFATYPRASSSERASFADSAVVSDGPRVIYDNPDSLLGVVVFTDGSHAPVSFDKANALTVSPEGPDALAVPTPAAKPTAAPATGTAVTTTTTVPPSPPVVSQKVSCQDTAQTPRAPQIAQTVPSVHSVLVRWTYPLLDEQDCEPDSWAIQIQAVGAPQPAQPVQTESGQLQYEFSGLRPSVQYQVTVTAYINTQSTTSASATFTTLATGADPPSTVTTAADGQGSWVVSWSPCTSSSCYVPAVTWVITGSSCGSFVGTPPVEKVDGSQTSVTIDAAQLGLLGDSMSFQVQGISAAGLTGDPTSDNSCTQAWQPPNPSAITVTGSGVASGDTITATVQVAASGNATTAFGSQSTTYTYHVGAATVGPTSATSVKIPGLAPGSQYTPTVTVTPTGHPAAAVTVTGAPFQQDLTWPAMSVTVQPTVDTDPNTGTVVATFSPTLPVALDATGNITCGSSSLGISQQQLAGGQITVPMDLTALGGYCTLNATLSEASSNEYALPDPQVTQSFTIGSPIDTSALVATYSSTTSAADVVVDVSGPPAPDAGSNWTITASWTPAVPAPAGCTGSSVSATSAAGPPTFPVQLDLGDCADNLYAISGDLDGVQPISVTATYKYLGQTQTVPLSGPGTGPVNTTTTTSTSTTVAPTTTTCQATTTSSSSSSSTTSSTSSTVASSTTTCTPTSDSAKISGGQPAQLAAAERARAADPSSSGRATLDVLGGGVLLAGAGALAAGRRRSISSRSPRRGR